MQSVLSLLTQSNNGSDTDKFVALSVLQTFLDSPQSDLRENHGGIVSIWKVMPHSFISRLLRSRPDPDAAMNMDNSHSMNHLAIGVLHAFINLLPQADLDNAVGQKYVKPLIEVIPITSHPQRALAYQSLQCLVNTHAGADAMVRLPKAIDCFGRAVEKDHADVESVVKILRASRSIENLSPVKIQRWDDMVKDFIPHIEENLALLLDMLTEQVNNYENATQQLPVWLEPALHSMKSSIMKRPSLALRTASVMFAGALLQHAPKSWDVPSLLFCQSQTASDSTAQFTTILTNLLLVDIRATIPGLMSSLMMPSYPATALRLAMSYELLTAFLSLLMRSLDDDDHVESSNAGRLQLDPDAILALRHDMSETLSNTIEYFRDRWDASFAGAAGLHSSARVIHTQTSRSVPLQLSWDSASLPPAKDPIFLASLRCLALWLCEDDNPSLQELTVGVMDLLVALYDSSLDLDSNDVRHPILMILSGLLSEEDAFEAFSAQDGWAILAKDLGESNALDPHIEELKSILDGPRALT